MTIAVFVHKQILGSEILSLILKSPLSESLINYEFRDLIINDETNKNLETFKTKLESNLERYQKRYGRNNRTKLMYKL